MLTNFINDISNPITALLAVIAFTMGVFYIIRGLMKAAKYGTDPRAYSMPNILVNLVIGAVLVTAGESLNVIMTSVFGSSTMHTAGDVDQWTAVANASTSFKNAIKAALTFFQIVGMIAFIRGWLVVKSAVEGSGQATMAQGFTHIIGGVLALNIYYFLEIMDTTFGTGMLGGS